MLTLRHGDVVIEQIDSVPNNCELLPRTGANGIVLAEGEATGHAHRIQAEPGIAELWMPNQPTNDNGTRFLVVDRVVSLAHEEHKTLQIPPGTYRVRVKRQYSPMGWERVRD